MYLLIDEKGDKGKKYLVKGNDDIHTNHGVIAAHELQKKKFGEIIETHIGHKYYVIEPNALDFMEKAKRSPQIMSLKDSALIAAHTGIRSESMIVEAGVGSGLNTMFLANIVYPEKLIGYEIREDFAEIARGNFKKSNIENVVIKLKDIYEGIDEEDIDLISLDLPEPWKVVPHAIGCLKIGAYIVSYSPSIEQAKKFYDALIESKGRFLIETVECLVRNWDLKVVRPHSRMLAHTGFITIARLINR